MKTIVIISAWILSGLIWVLWDRGLRDWIKNSFLYCKRKRDLIKKLDAMDQMDIVDYWQKNLVDLPENKWYYRRLEKYIRENYIVPIIGIWKHTD